MNRLEHDLLDIRDGTAEKKRDYLSTSESRVLSLCENVGESIRFLVGLLKSLQKQIEGKMGRVLKGEAERGTLKYNLKSDCVNIQKGLNGFHKELLDLFELEKEVEKLTADYINT